MENVVFFRESQQNNIVKSASELAGKSAKEILEIFQHQDKTLFIKTPFYLRPIENFEKPLLMFPQAILNSTPKENDIPDIYFLFQSLKFPHQISLYIRTSIPNAEIPLFETCLDLDNTATGQDIFKAIEESFTMPHTNSETSSFKMNESADDIVFHFQSQNILLHCELTDEAIKMMKQRSDILCEIQETEHTYLDDLKLLTHFWEPTIRNLHIFDDYEVTQIFKDFPMIHKCHKCFYDGLIDRGTEFSVNVGDLFLEYSDYFKVSLPFISNYHSIMHILDTRLQKIQSIQAPNNGKDLSSYLITPIQRIPRYILFINNLLKYTPSCHPDYELLQLACEKIQNISIEMDIATKKATQMNEIWLIQKSLTKPFQLMFPNRYLKSTINVRFKDQPCHFYLFNDLVTINSYDRRSQTILYQSPLITFHYFPCYEQIGIQRKKKINFVIFPSEKIREDIVAQLEDFRFGQNKRSSTDLSAFLWSNPFVPRYLPKLTFSDGVRINDTYIFYGDNKIITANMKMLSVKVNESQFGSRFGFAMTTNQTDKVFIIGGKNSDDNYFNDIWQYDILLNKWTNLTRNQYRYSKIYEFKPRMEHSAVYHDNAIYVFGGRNRKKFFNDVCIFSLVNNQWEIIKLDIAPSPRSLHSAVFIDNKMIVLGGHSHQHIFNDINVFDTATKRWNAVTYDSSAIPKRYGHRSIVLQSMIVSIGGTNDNENDDLGPFVIFCQDNFSCRRYHSIGNYPDKFLADCCFALCFDNDSLSMYVYAYCSIYLVQLPLEIKNLFVQNAQSELRDRLFNTRVKLQKKQSATLDEGEMYQSLQNRILLQKYGTFYTERHDVDSIQHSKVKLPPISDNSQSYAAHIANLKKASAFNTSTTNDHSVIQTPSTTTDDKNKTTELINRNENNSNADTYNMSTAMSVWHRRMTMDCGKRYNVNGSNVLPILKPLTRNGQTTKIEGNQIDSDSNSDNLTYSTTTNSTSYTPSDQNEVSSSTTAPKNPKNEQVTTNEPTDHKNADSAQSDNTNC